jgi:hypothetical protein
MLTEEEIQLKKEKRKEYMREYRQKPEVKEKNRERTRALLKTDKYKEYKRNYNKRPENIERLNKKKKTDEYKEYHRKKQAEYMQTEKGKMNREKNKEYSKNYREKNREKIKELAKKYTSSECCKLAKRKWNKENYDKVKAYKTVENKKSKGNLLIEKCLICGSEKVNAHHEDYAKPLSVVWLCTLCHNRYHRGLLAKSECKKIIDKFKEVSICKR